MRNKKLAISLINYNSDYDTIECLKSLSYHLPSSFYKVFLIDNSIKKSQTLLSFIRSCNIEIEYQFLNRNSGFAEGNNIGIRKAIKEEFDQIMLLNNDVVIIDDSIQRSSVLLDNNNKIGILGLINYFHSKPSKIWQYGFKQNIKLAYFFKPRMNLKNDFNYCDYVPGSSIIIKKNLFKQLGYLDENYFAYFEEIDFCTRAKIANYKIGYVSNSRILHKVGISSSKPVKYYLKTRNSLYYYSKHLSPINFKILLPKLFIKPITKALLDRNILQNLKAIWMGYQDFKKKNFRTGSLDSLILN